MKMKLISFKLILCFKEIFTLHFLTSASASNRILQNFPLSSFDGYLKHLFHVKLFIFELIRSKIVMSFNLFLGTDYFNKFIESINKEYYRKSI